MAPQDSFIEDEDETCPLCIEELDLTDRNFRPCPCGYKVCQFCFNNIRNNINGLCPACRRPYDEKTIQYKIVTPEEIAEFSRNIQKNQKKRVQEQKQKEAQKREAERETRKNLIGVRVVQKNLVYVTGLAAGGREDELLKMLRKPEFFGQYGNIQKISISNRKSPDGQHHSLGIYVTFEKPDDAYRCILAVDGSVNGDRVLKAQYGTTKYCSAWLKFEKCNNPGCMFLHEKADDENSYTRQDLSSLNFLTQTDRPLNSGSTSARAVSRQQGPQPTPPPTSQPMRPSLSKDGVVDNPVDTSALPSSANWARNPQRSRRGSHATSGAASSPAVSTSLPVTAETATENVVPDAESSTTIPAYLRNLAPRDAVFDEEIAALLSFQLPKIRVPDFEKYPPMFDLRGGEKRRVMREEEDSRIANPDDQLEALVSSEEPETGGGSLALGGEPEERELAGDGHSFDQRQVSTQPPIQRGSTDGILGTGPGGSSFGQGSSRSMTPQQLTSIRSAAGFGDQGSPAISSQSTAFQGQGQGHSRQPSRFNFASDNTNSSSTVKLAANPRNMAQQTSMMPNSFQSQGANQYYPTTISGPPPGLKSTGTPPNMYGQSFGAGFGAAPKDSSNELLQSLIGRNRAGVSQPHDAGKREYMISSFSNQYPPSSTSTPVPASNLLASLYGNQPGAFQDFGSKQKKKGKKHRHANTSSSGGSGLVDLADPSILQARMQHQQPQSTAGASQGLYGGQSQADDELLSFDKASEAVDDLLHDPQDDLGQLGIALSSAMPSVPPGFAGPHGHPDPTQPSSAPTLPWLLTPVPKVAAAGINHGTMTPEQTPRKGRLGSTARRGGKSLTTDSGAPKGAPSLSSQTQPLAVQDDENFPPLATQARKQQSSSPAIPTVPTPKGTPAPKRSSDKGKVPEKVSQLNLEKSRGQQKLDKERALEGARASTDGKQPQQKQPADRSKATMKTSELSFQNMPEDMSSNQAVASHSSRKPGSAGDEGLNAPTPRSEDSTRPQGSTDEVVFPPLPTPSGSGAASPAPRVAPKSLRLVSPVKTDTSTLPSLVQSLASRVVSASQGPDTAASDMASDTASLVSASVSASRAGSPPPNRIGSAAVRTSTKSSQRKERKKAFQEETKVISERPKEEPKPHDAIVVRKKKEKKEKPTRASAPPSQDEPLADAAIQDGPVTESTSKEGASSKESDGADLKDKLLPSRKGASSRKGKGKGKGKEKGKERETREVAQPQPTPPAADAEPNSTAQADEAERSRFSPAGVFAGLANLFKGEDLALFKPVPSGNQRQEHNSGAKNGAYCKDCACKCAEIREEDLAALRAGKPVRKQFHMDGGRMLITPNGDSIRGLSPNEEDAFLQLQTAIALSAEHPGAFVAPRHHPGSGAFSLIKGRAVPNGRPNIFPLTCHPSSPDPVGKMQREEALSYINQYVLPRLNLGASNMGFPNAASPARDSAAASLNSLAPYFYGPDAAAGVGIYSAPDGARAMRDFAASGGSQSEEPGKIPGTNGVSSMPLMSVEDAESALFAARRETEKLERGLNAVIKRNRRLVLGGS